MARRTGSGRNGVDLDTYVAHTLKAEGFDASEDGTGRGIPLCFSRKDDGVDAGEISPTLRSGNGQNSTGGGVQPAIAFSAGNSVDAYGIAASIDHTPPLRAANSGTNQVPTIAFSNTAGDTALSASEETFPPITRRHGDPGMVATHVVRRLTPEECELLQAFPQGYTAITYRGKPAADGPRYRALGNSMTTSIPKWIGERIQILEELLAEDEGAA